LSIHASQKILNMVWYEIRFLPLIFPSHPKSRIERNVLIASEDDT